VRRSRAALGSIWPYALAILCLLAMFGIARGASTAENLPVNASVVQKCLITASALSFGTYDPVASNAASPLTGTGALGVTCTRSATSISVALSMGSNASGAQRRLKSGSDYLTYELYQPSSTSANAACTFPGSIVWGTAGGGLFSPTGSTWGAASPQNFNVCGSVPGGQDAPTGSYTDTVVATVSF
jgi:spore coat protein U-like protein